VGAPLKAVPGFSLDDVLNAVSKAKAAVNSATGAQSNNHRQRFRPPPSTKTTVKMDARVSALRSKVDGKRKAPPAPLQKPPVGRTATGTAAVAAVADTPTPSRPPPAAPGKVQGKVARADERAVAPVRLRARGPQWRRPPAEPKPFKLQQETATAQLLQAQSTESDERSEHPSATNGGLANGGVDAEGSSDRSNWVSPRHFQSPARSPLRSASGGRRGYSGRKKQPLLISDDDDDGGSGPVLPTFNL
jgi:hypothetical protein